MFRKKKTRCVSSLRRHSKFEALEQRLLLAADWQNPVNEFDVNGSDGPVAVTPLDALLIINELSAPAVSHSVTRVLPELGPDAAEPAFYPDVDGNGVVSPFDALLVIDELSNNRSDIAVDVLDFTDIFLAGSRAALSHGVEHDTLVNTVTRRTQSLPDVAAGASGDIVVVWQSHDQDGSSWGVFAQRYSADGVKIGDEIAVNTTTRRSQRDPAVAMDDAGNFVVVWNSKSQDGSSWGVYGQLFTSVGEAVGDEFLVNQTTKRAQALADIAFLSDGQFLVSWEGRGAGDDDGVFVRRFSLDDDGVTPVTDETLVNTTTRSDQENSSVAALPNGEFIVAWDGRGPDDSHGVYMRRMGGDIESPEIRVNDETDHVQRRPSVSVGGDGQFVVAWQQSRDNGTGRGIRAQRYDSSGDPIGDAILVNQTQQSRQKGATVAYLADGSFSVSWYGRGAGDRDGVFTRNFDTDGTPTDDEQLVNFHVQKNQGRPSAAAVNNGYVVTWRGRGADDRRGVFARFFDTEVQGPFRLDPIGNQTVDEESLLSVQANVVDTDGQADNVTFSLDAAPDGAAIDPNTGEFTWTPSEADGPGTFDVTVTATEGDFSDARSFTITVNEVNLAPTLATIDDQTILSGTQFSLIVTATDPDLPANVLTLTASLADGSPLPAWLTFDAATQTFGGTPGDADVGTSDIRVTVTDDGGLSDEQTFSITVVLGPFELEAIADQTVDEESLLSLTASVVDTDGQVDNVTFSLDDAPAGAAIDPATGGFTWTPSEADGPGNFDVTVTATEGDFSSSQSFGITVNEVNLPPELAAIEDQMISSETPFTLTVSATDPDLPANALTYVATLEDGSPLPAWLTFDAATQTFSGTPGDADAGTIDVRVTVTDDGDLSDQQTFSITVIAGPFRLEPIADQTVNEETQLSLTATIIDTDGQPDNVTFSLDTAPTGAVMNTLTGEFTWTPSEADGPGEFDVTIRATEGDFSDSQSFSVTVNEVNIDPVLADIADQTVATDTFFSIGVVAIDPDLPANILTYDVTLDDGSALPDWLTFDSETLLLSGTPSAADAGTIDLLATVTDGAGGADAETFSITVTVNSPPQLVTAIPDQTAQQDEAYTFDVSVFFNDPDGDALSYAAVVVDGNGDGSLPSWLSFDTANGVFSGTPTSEFVDTTTSIEVTTSDPNEASVSDTFDLSVIFVPNLPPAVSEQVFRIDAGASDGAIVGTVAATDPNPGDTLTYSITAGNDGGTFAIDDTTGTISVASAAGLQDGSMDVLTVEVSDGELSGTAAVTIYTTSEPVAVGYTLAAFDAAGNPITQVSPGQEFELRLFVQDRRDAPAKQGAFSAYADITYPATLVSVNGSIVHSSIYGEGLSGNTDTPGLVDEAGGVDGINDLGGDPIEVVRVSFIVDNDVAAGTVLHFAINETEDQVQHLTSLFGETAAVAAERIDFGTLSLTVVDEP